MAPHSSLDTAITFASGAAYGVTTVAVGQPFDTIKTIQQSAPAGTRESILTIGRHISCFEFTSWWQGRRA